MKADEHPDSLFIDAQRTTPDPRRSGDRWSTL